MAISHASRFLKGNERISALIAEIERSSALLQAVRRTLPPPCEAHCLHAGLQEGVLTLTADSPAWAARLRFAAPLVLGALGRGYGRINACRVRVQPESEPHRPAEDRPRLSPATAHHLRQAAEDMEDERIAAALRRLAQGGTPD